MTNIISYGWGSELAIGKIVDSLYKTVLTEASKTFKNPVIVDTTWIGSNNLSNVIGRITVINPDIIILCSFVDATDVTALDFAHLGINTVSIGNFNEGNRVDFWSIVLNERYSYKDTTPTNIKYPFMSYNSKPHSHRIALRNEFGHLHLINKGAVSFGGEFPILSPEDRIQIAYEESGGGDSVLNDTMTLGDINIWNTSLVNIITETEYNPIDRCFYSEKTWKPMLGKRPFLHYTEVSVNDELNRWGFETFEHSFTDICDLDLTISSNIALFCNTLVQQPNSYFLHKYTELLPKINHNHDYFFKFANKQHENLTNIHY
jgi:hypothetical protein